MFKSKTELELDTLIRQIDSNMSNNYKDAAQADFKELEKVFLEAVAAGRLKGKAKERYESKVNSYQVRLKGYSHKDQKPYWT